jgi:hypothetical protein|tara:strand:+ start:114 stop:287 length:174 start_codon:yes stop_codon:yes gene_type:complete
MDITSAQYVRDIYGENYAINIVVGGKTFCVPPSQNNTDYQAVLAWAEEDGNEIQAAE